MADEVTEKQIIALYNEFKDRYNQVPAHEHMGIITVALQFMTVEQVKQWYQTTGPKLDDPAMGRIRHDINLVMLLEAQHYFGKEKKEDYVPLAETGKVAPVTSGPMTQ